MKPLLVLARSVRPDDAGLIADRLAEEKGPLWKRFYETRMEKFENLLFRSDDDLAIQYLKFPHGQSLAPGVAA